MDSCQKIVTWLWNSAIGNQHRNDQIGFEVWSHFFHDSLRPHLGLISFLCSLLMYLCWITIMTLVLSFWVVVHLATIYSLATPNNTLSLFSYGAANQCGIVMRFCTLRILHNWGEKHLGIFLQYDLIMFWKLREFKEDVVEYKLAHLSSGICLLENSASETNMRSLNHSILCMLMWRFLWQNMQWNTRKSFRVSTWVSDQKDMVFLDSIPYLIETVPAMK